VLCISTFPYNTCRMQSVGTLVSFLLVVIFPSFPHYAFNVECGAYFPSFISLLYLSTFFGSTCGIKSVENHVSLCAFPHLKTWFGVHALPHIHNWLGVLEFQHLVKSVECGALHSIHYKFLDFFTLHLVFAFNVFFHLYLSTSSVKFLHSHMFSYGMERKLNILVSIL